MSKESLEKNDLDNPVSEKSIEMTSSERKIADRILTILPLHEENGLTAPEIFNKLTKGGISDVTLQIVMDLMPILCEQEGVERVKDGDVSRYRKTSFGAPSGTSESLKRFLSQQF